MHQVPGHFHAAGRAEAQRFGRVKEQQALRERRLRRRWQRQRATLHGWSRLSAWWQYELLVAEARRRSRNELAPAAACYVTHPHPVD